MINLDSLNKMKAPRVKEAKKGKNGRQYYVSKETAEKVYSVIPKVGSIKRSLIMEQINMHHSTISNAIYYLLEQGRITLKEHSGSGGMYHTVSVVSD